MLAVKSAGKFSDHDLLNLPTAGMKI